jgi:hypothetical protein
LIIGAVLSEIQYKINTLLFILKILFDKRLEWIYSESTAAFPKIEILEKPFLRRNL